MLLQFNQKCVGSAAVTSFSREPSFPVSPKQAVEVRPTYELKADAYVLVRTFGVLRVYSVFAVRENQTLTQLTDEAMSIIRKAGTWIKFADAAVNVEVVHDTNRVFLRLGKTDVADIAINDHDLSYAITFNKDLDLTTKTALDRLVRSHLEELVMDEQDSLVIDQLKELMRNHESRIGVKLTYDDWEALLCEAYDRMYQEEKCPPVPPSL